MTLAKKLPFVQPPNCLMASQVRLRRRQMHCFFKKLPLVPAHAGQETRTRLSHPRQLSFRTNSLEITDIIALSNPRGPFTCVGYHDVTSCRSRKIATKEVTSRKSSVLLSSLADFFFVSSYRIYCAGRKLQLRCRALAELELRLKWRQQLSASLQLVVVICRGMDVLGLMLLQHR